MSVAGIASSGLSHLANVLRNYQHVRAEFKNLGQGAQPGNLAPAQADFVTLSQSLTSQLSSTSPLNKALDTVGQALQLGDLTTAQQAFAPISNAMGASAVHHHHGFARPAAVENHFSQLLGQLGVALQSGDISAAQQAFAAVQQLRGQMPPGQATAAASSAAAPAGGAFSMTA